MKAIRLRIMVPNSKDPIPDSTSPPVSDADPLAHVVCMTAAGNRPTRKYPDSTVDAIPSLAGFKIPLTAPHPAIGRQAACVIRTGALYENLGGQGALSMENIGKGDMDTFIASCDASSCSGAGCGPRCRADTAGCAR